MTKRWLSILLTLMLLITGITGVSAAPVAKTVVPLITFETAVPEIDITGKTSVSNQLLGTFEVDGRAATTAESTLIEGLIRTVKYDGIGYFTPDEGGAANLQGCSWYLSAGKLYATLAAFDQVPVADGKGEAVVMIELKDAVPALTNYALQLGNSEKNISLTKLKVYEPIDGVTLSTTTASQDGAIQVLGTSFVMEGKDRTGLLQATATPDTGVVASYEWESSDATVASVVPDAADTSKATVTSLKAGRATIKATAKNAKGDKSGTWSVTVNPLYSTTIAVEMLTGTANQIALGSSAQLKATLGSNVTETALTWSSSDNTVATVTSDGLVKLTALAREGDHFNVYATDGKGTRGSYQFEVTEVNNTAQAPGFILDGALAGTPTVVNKAGSVLKMVSNTDGAQIYYIKTTDAVAPGNQTVKDTGTLYTGPIALDKNETVFYHAVAYKAGLTTPLSALASIWVKVEIAPQKVTIAPSSSAMQGRGELTLTAAVTPTGSTHDDIDWSISAANGVTGEVSADTKSYKLTVGDFEGSFTVTAKATGTGGVSGVQDTRTITVTKVNAAGVTAPSSITVAKGEQVLIDAKVSPTNATKQALAYELTFVDPAKKAAQLKLLGGNEADSINATEGAVYLVGEDAGTTALTITNAAGVRKLINVTVTGESSTVAAPKFSETDGKQFAGAGKVFLSCTTLNAVIEYTVDGSDPRTSATADTYSAAGIDIPVNQSRTIRAYAILAPKADSAVVSATYHSVVALTELELTGTKTIAGAGNQDAPTVGDGAVELTATLVGDGVNNPKDTELEWTTSNANVAVVKTQTVADVLTQKAWVIGVQPGSATITVTNKASGKSATLSVTVTTVVPVTVQVQDNTGASVDAFSLPLDQTKQLKAKVNPDNVTNKNVTWASSNAGIATVDANGKVTPVAVGSATISVAAVAKGSTGLTVEDVATVTVTDATGTVAKPIVTPVSGTYETEITVDIECPTTGAQVYYTLDGQTPSASSTPYTGAFKLHDDAIVRAIAIKGTQTEMAETRYYTFNIKPVKVQIDKSKTTFAVGEAYTMKATLTPDYVSSANKTVTWTTSDADVIDVNSATGALTVKTVGTATITATATAGQNVTDFVTLLVQPVAVTSVTLQPSTIVMGVGDTKSLSAIIQPSNADDKQLSWISSAPTAVSVANGTITALAAGSATITATAANGIKGTATVTVTADPSTPPVEPTKIPLFTASASNFEVIENGSLVKELGKFNPGEGQTWDQIAYYYDVTFTSTELAGKGTIDVAKDGTVTLYVSDAGKDNLSFNYTWKMAWKNIRGAAGVLNNEQRTVTGNMLIIVKKPTAIQFTPYAVADLEMKGYETKSAIVGKIDNYGDFVKTASKVNAAASTGTATIGSDGTVTVTLTNIKKAEYTVVVTLSAAGCTDVKTTGFKLNVTEDPTPPVAAITVSAKSGVWTGKKGLYNLALADGTVQFKVEGYNVTRWTATYPKYMTINATTGEATLNKYRDGITVTAYLEGGKKLTKKVNIIKIASEIKLQYRNAKGKWIDFSNTSPLVLEVGKKVLTRAYTVTPSGGKQFDLKWIIGDATTAFRGTKGYINGEKEGSTTVKVTLFNGVSAEAIVNIVPKGSKGAVDALDETEDIVPVDEIDEIDETPVVPEPSEPLVPDATPTAEAPAEEPAEGEEVPVETPAADAE